MTSTASQQNTVPAQNTSASSATSYASAAGATKKPTSTPLSAAASNPPPVVVGSSAPGTQQPQQAQYGKPSSASPVNGRPAITPALPAPASAVPAVAHGTTNGHDRKGSVTISANGPNSYMANGGPASGAKSGIQFGYKESPAIAHISPQPPSAPIPIPGNAGARVPSPAHSPSPIPQPSASGGRPPSMMAQDGPAMKFGSLGGDAERHNNNKHLPAQGPLNALPTGSPHMRHGSTHSINENMTGHVNHGSHGGHGGQNSTRGGYGGRGRGYNNPPGGFNPTMGYPPGGQYHGGGRGGAGGQGRGMNAYQNPRGMAPYQNSPQNRGSPAMNTVLPNPGTPTMNPSLPVHPPQAGYNAYMPPPYQNTYGYPAGTYDPRMGMGQPFYPQMQIQYMPQPGPSPQQTFQQPYAQQPFVPQPGAQPMSRNPSQMSAGVERPGSSTGQPQPPVVVGQGPTPLAHGATAKPAVVSSGSSFVLPKKKAAVTIKNAQGEALDLTSLKAPASPAPSIQQSKTPPVATSSPTPPPHKPGTPSHGHGRSDSAATSKTAEQLRNEFKEQVRKTTEAAPAEAKELTPPATEVTHDEPAEKPAAVEASSAEPETKPVVEEPKAVAPVARSEPVLETTAAPQVAPASPVPTPDEKREAAKTEETKKDESAKAPRTAADEDAEMERIIREMEELEAKREKEAAEYEAKKQAAKEEEKKKAELARAEAAEENDRKLREQEREAERLEEEKERKRNAAAQPAAEDKSSTAKSSEAKDKEATPDAVADKLTNLSIRSGSPSQVAPGPKSGGSEKRSNKPAALNLTPLNTKPVEPPQPSAALQSLKSARFLAAIGPSVYPPGINSPNPALNSAVQRKNRNFKYDTNFLLQFQKVFTEQPSLDFGQQVKSLIGDSDRSATRTPASSARQNSRTAGGQPGGGFGGPMGFFGGPSGGAPSQLPPGTTSEQRFKQSNAARGMSGGVGGMGGMGGMGSFPRPFPGATQMARTPSSSNMGGPGGMPNSPRQRSMRGGGSKRFDAKADAQAAKTMPLTQGVELKPITVSASGWKPSVMGGGRAAAASSGQPGHMDPEMVQRKVKAALNKMTPEKFDKIADQILAIAAQSKDEQDGRTLRQVIQLTFEKATDEAHWASMYARFCKRMLDTMSPDIRDVSIVDKHGAVVSGGALFRKYLLNRCQEEFERGWKEAAEATDAADAAEGEAKDKKSAPGEAAMLSDEYYIAAAAKRRGLGLVQFIGELYKLGMLTERIMHQCVHKLVDYRSIPDEAEIESLCKLLRTIGGNLDVNSEKTQGRQLMDAYFARINNAINMPELNSRLKFMLMDLVDLRKANWISKESNKGPKTLDEVRADAEAAAAQKAAENARSNQRGGPGGRPPMGGRGGDGRGPSGYGPPAANQNQVGMDDLRRLQRSATRTSSQNATFGPSSMFTSRSNSGRARMGPGGSFNRAGEDSNASSRTGTPPTREPTSHANAFSLLANMETENPASPPSTSASPALSKAVPDASATKGRD